MRKIAVIFLLAFSLSGLCRADTDVPLKFYKLDFVVQELDGAKVINSREYSAIAATGVPENSSIRVNSNLVLQTSPQSIQPFEIGVSIDVEALKEMEGGLSLTIAAMVDSVSTDAEPNSRPISRKII